MTNKVFSVILFAYMEGLAASVEVSRARPPESPVSLYSSDLIAIISDESPDRLLACSPIDSQSQKKSGKTGIQAAVVYTERPSRLLACKLDLDLGNQLSTGNWGLSSPRIV